MSTLKQRARRVERLLARQEKLEQREVDQARLGRAPGGVEAPVAGEADRVLERVERLEARARHDARGGLDREADGTRPASVVPKLRSTCGLLLADVERASNRTRR